MNALDWLNPADVLLELDPRRLRAIRGGELREWVLERTGSGALSDACQGRIRAELTAFLGRQPWQTRAAAVCALSGHGVSLRRWKVPRTAPDDLAQVLRLQLESELPLPPDDLAWGWWACGEEGPLLDILVAAVKREVVEEATALFHACGLSPSFTLAALARLALAPPEPHEGPGAVLDLGTQDSEWLGLDAGGPARLRILPWGEETIIAALLTRGGLDRTAAEGLLAGWATGVTGELSEAVKSALATALDSLAAVLPAGGPGPRLRVSGRLAAYPGVLALLTERLGPDTRCTALEAAGTGLFTSALRGLRRQADNPASGAIGLRLKARPMESRTGLAQPAPRKWAIVAALLLLGLLALPYAEALLLRPRLAARVASIKSNREGLALIDRESDFLRHLKHNQAPYLETLYVLAKTAPPGARIESLTVNRKGEVSLRITMRQPPEVTGFRTKLVDSGFFASVVLEEQSPSPDRQKILARLSAVLKPATAREALKILAPEEAGASNALPGVPGMPVMPGGTAALPPPGPVAMPPGVRVMNP